jgi:hypothetical protein
VSACLRELEMIGSTGNAQHYAIEPVMISKRAEDSQSHTIAIEPHDLLKVLGWAGDAHRDSGFHY